MIKEVTIIFLFISSICFSQSYYEDGCNKYHNGGNLDSAISLFTRSIAANQEVSKSYMMRAAAKIQLNELSSAYSDLDSSKRIDSLYYKLYYYYGRVSLLEKLYSTALRYFNKVISMNPNYPNAYDNRAIVKGIQNDYIGAINDENIAIQIDSTNEIFYCNRGFANLQLKKYDDAIKDCDIALRLEEDQKAYANRGTALAMKGMDSLAIRDFNKALTLLPNDPEIYYRRGLSYKSLNQKDKACLDFDKSARLGYLPAIQQKINCPSK